MTTGSSVGIGSSAVTTVGTITSGAWNASLITGTYGGTGVNNGTSTITIGGNVTFSGAFTFAGTVTGNTSVTFPTSGTLATTSQIPSLPLSLANGGTNANLTANNGGIFYSTASAGAILAGTATANQMLLSGASTTPAWSTSTIPATNAAGDILYGSAANVWSSLAKDTNATRYLANTGTSNVPKWDQINLTNGVTGALPILNGGTGLTTAPNFYVQGRLTLTTGTPVTTSDVSAAATLYFTPYKGNWLSLYTSSAWKLYTFTELSIAAPAVANQMYDVFVYDNTGTITLELVAWTNDTTRATALTTQNGVLVKSGSTDRLYLGSVRTKTASQFNDTLAFRHVWNYYNRVRTNMLVTEPTDTWTYTTSTYRQANNNAANQLDFVIGYSEDVVDAQVQVVVNNTSADNYAIAAIGLDSTTVSSANIMIPGYAAAGSNPSSTYSSYTGYPGIGRHLLVWIEQAGVVGTQTWGGDFGAPTVVQSGIRGTILN